MSVHFNSLNILLLITCWILTSCANNNEMEAEIKKIISKPIIIPIEEMHFVSKDIIKNRFANDSEYKLIIYSDTSMCSPCQFRMLFEWNKLEYLEKDSLVDFYFIFRTNNLKELKQLYFDSYLEHYIFADTNGIFNYKNPQIPHNPLFHCFLTNQDNEIVLIGNPLKNEDINKLMQQIIKHKIKSPFEIYNNN